MVVSVREKVYSDIRYTQLLEKFSSALSDLESQRRVNEIARGIFLAIKQTVQDRAIIIARYGKCKCCETKSICVVDWNEESTGMFGYSEEEAVGMSVHHLVPERYLSKHFSGVGKYIEDPGTGLTGVVYSKVVAAVTKSGEEIPIDISVSSFRLDDKNNRHYIASIKRMEEANGGK